jgi:hypothetical protein
VTGQFMFTLLYSNKTQTCTHMSADHSGRAVTHSWSWALLEKLSIVQLLENFPAFYGTRRFITTFTWALHRSLSWARSIQSLPSHPTSLRSMNCLHSLELWDRGFESKSRHGCLCAFILCLCCSVCRYRPCDGLIPRPRSPADCV